MNAPPLPRDPYAPPAPPDERRPPRRKRSNALWWIVLLVLLVVLVVWDMNTTGKGQQQNASVPLQDSSALPGTTPTPPADRKADRSPSTANAPPPFNGLTEANVLETLRAHDLRVDRESDGVHLAVRNGFGAEQRVEVQAAGGQLVSIRATVTAEGTLTGERALQELVRTVADLPWAGVPKETLRAWLEAHADDPFAERAFGRVNITLQTPDRHTHHIRLTGIAPESGR